MNSHCMRGSLFKTHSLPWRPNVLKWPSSHFLLFQSPLNSTVATKWHHELDFFSFFTSSGHLHIAYSRREWGKIELKEDEKWQNNNHGNRMSDLVVEDIASCAVASEKLDKILSIGQVLIGW